MSDLQGPSAASRRRESADLDQALAFRIHRTNRLLRTHLGRFLELHQPVRQVDLAEPVLGDPPNVSRLVDALVDRGWVERSPDQTDRRSWLVSVTSHGRSRSDRLLRRVAAERQLVFDGFADSELAALLRALDRIDDNVRQLLTSPPSS